ncbi:hypothetical protein COV58_01400 [Candidatus Roizmanbacteria bacterium CG11_big_fil_rev_8_21_14_0_20_36_8]|uniref:Uncharacterized protein n=2 Tax=Candidatus Roizmaniibacteriota TaxID=1752723 RepID=A0A2M6IUL1_9BACT|nr:MAG: hypothetical protein COV58_01400 [Candidatus Roizmanbacteria bacterium CG11_big_fil_rev_8_21_14_0_20_36_8]PIZ66085.1 MAG: hypothetical protein COY14_00980 [Candidatus Roizmanbacteria bacterium CG_4_10_14_0_2_um_filter_36_9]
MISKRLIRFKLNNLRFVVILVLLVFLTAIIYFFPPINLFLIALNILVITCITYLASDFLSSVKRKYMLTFFVFSQLWMIYFVGIDVINTLLLISFIIVAAKLLPNKSHDK